MSEFSPDNPNAEQIDYWNGEAGEGWAERDQQMEKTLAHEFGHHWTLGYFMDRHEMIGWFNERAPWLYYRIRGLDPNKFAADYSKGWSYCDKEVLAEDYKYQFSPYKGMHRMQNLVNNPTSEVGDFISALGKPYWA